MGSDKPVSERVVAILHEACELVRDGQPLPEGWSMDDDLFVSWGFDSMAMAAVAIEIQRTLHVRLSDAALLSVRTPRELVALVDSLHEATEG
jgi:acyl carrier protein